MTGSLGRLGLMLLSALFVMAIAQQAARLTWTLAGETGARTSDIATATTTAGDTADVDLSPIFALSPFGNPAVVEAPEPVAQETDLGLVLRGITIAVPARNSIAVIALKEGDAKIYGIGESIEGKAVLKEIQSDKVMLDVGGKSEFLGFPKPGTEKKTVIGGGFIIGNANGGNDTTASTGKPKAPVMEQYRDKITKNPKAFLEKLGVSVSQKGYTIDENANPGVLRAGLKPGDLISKVNGETVGDIEKDRRLLDTVIASGRVRVEVVRNGHKVIMSFPLP